MPRIAADRGSAEEGIRASERANARGSRSRDRRWIRSRNKLIPMISLDRIRIECAGNLPKNRRADVPFHIRRISHMWLHQIDRFRLFPETIFLPASCIIPGYRVESHFEAFVLMHDSTFSRPRDLVDPKCQSIAFRSASGFSCNRYQSLSHITRYDRWQTSQRGLDSDCNVKDRQRFTEFGEDIFYENIKSTIGNLCVLPYL